MDITDYRNEIDRIDEELVRLFTKRLAVCDKIAEYKKEHGLAIHDEKREREKLAVIRNLAGDDAGEELTIELFEKIMELSVRRQETK